MKIFNKIFVVLIVSLFIYTSFLNAQICRVLDNPAFPSVPNSSFGDPNLLLQYEPTEVRTIYVAIHIVRSSAGLGGISTTDISTSMQQLNTAYTDVMIQFVHNQTDYIDNDTYVELTEIEYYTLKTINNISNKVNIYFVPSADGFNGISQYVTNSCAVTNEAAINGSTLAHEVGHEFYLYHTHGTGIQELVNGSNCSSAGDFLCDTPAEPYNNNHGILNYVYTNSCGYFGTFRDANNQLYTPDTHNFMGYSVASCRVHFSPLQIQKINQTLATSMSYLINTSVSLANKIEGNIITNVPNVRTSTLTVVGVATVNSGTSVNLLNGNSYDIKTNQERFPTYSTYGNIKHNNWNIQAPQFKLSENYTVEGTTSPFRDANFQGMKHSLIEGNAENVFTVGSFQFQDPWYIKSDGTQPGNYWIPCNATYEPNGKEGASEKGVFLNQDPTFDPNIPNYSVKVDPYQDIPVSQTGRTHRFYFHKWSGTNANFQYPNSTETGVVFTDENSIVQANLKGTQLSDNEFSYSSNSQNKFVRTENGNLHNVYVSMGALWYERSTNGGATWEIANYGRALNTDNPKGVSIDYLPPSSGDDIITIAYQCTTSTGSKVVVDVFKNGQPRTPVYYRYTVIDFSHSQNDYDEMNAEPVISVSSGWDVMVVYKVPALLPLEGNPVTTSALYYSLGWLNGLVGWELTWYSPNNKWVIIPTTNYNSIHPAIAEDVYSTSNPTNYFHIAYQENNQIKYYYKFGQVRTGSLSQNSNPICISCNNGFSQNYSPSIISAGQTARVCWVGYRLVTQEGEYEVEAVPQYKVLFKDPFNTSRYWQFGNDVSAPSFNRSPNYYAFGWREASNQNKFADNNLSTVRTLNTSGQELQICNGTASSNMYAMSYNRNDGLPYYFLMSNNLGSFYSLAKTTAISFSSGREGIVAVDNAEFYFALGDINIDGQTVDFEEISDTVSISDIVSLNQNLISKPMNITDNSSFVYSVQYGINDSLSVAQSLVDQRTVNFKVMLIDNTTGETIGVYDDITYNSSNLYQYNSISYQVNTAGIGNKTIRLKLVLNNNFDAAYSLSKIYSNESVLAKANHKQIEFDGGGVVKEYALAQNYPNPFNPSTTIRYQIPQDGIVTLKIYDVLGAEVATLVNEQKAAGKYEVNFSATGRASALASGVYIYKIQAGSFASSKKMLMVK